MANRAAGCQHRLRERGYLDRDIALRAGGSNGVRIDGGLLGFPVGLANLTLQRPHLNPTISQPASLFSPLPPVEPRGPRGNLLGAIYPFGGQVTVSGAQWDARAAVIDTSPLRRRGIFVDSKPPRFTNVVVGGGVAPFIGFRIGASVTHGGWMGAGESPTNTVGRDATVYTVESELSFAHTKLAGEWVRDSIDTSTESRVASGWFVQGQQTLAPRWFRGTSRTHRLSARDTDQRRGPAPQNLRGGPRLPVDFRNHRPRGPSARQGFGRPDFDHQFALALVWWKRWIYSELLMPLASIPPTDTRALFRPVAAELVALLV